MESGPNKFCKLFPMVPFDLQKITICTYGYTHTGLMSVDMNLETLHEQFRGMEPGSHEIFKCSLEDHLTF